MFDFLEKLPTTRAISGVYYAVRLISHRGQLDGIRDGFSSQNLTSEPSAEDGQVALSILEEIEAAEGLNLQVIDDSSAEEYLIRLSQIVQQRAILEFGCDLEKGRELLEEFEPAISQQVGQNSA